MNELNSIQSAVSTPKHKQVNVIDFTVERIHGIEPPTDVERVEYKDSREKGLYLRVTRSGVKTFAYVGRAKGSAKVERITLGKFPIVKPSEARTKARELSGHQASGSSVSAEGRARRQEMTVADLWDRYREHLVTKKSPESAQIAWNVYIGPKWGRRRLSEVSYSEVEKWHRELPNIVLANRKAASDQVTARRSKAAAEIAARRLIRKHGPMPSSSREIVAKPLNSRITGKTQANRCIEILRAMYNWALHPKRKLFSGQNPAAQQESHQEAERSRFIQADELGNFFKALAGMANTTVRDAILTSLLAGARKANILSMKWEDIHLERMEWSLPGEFQKNGEPYVVPLVPELVELLRVRKVASEQQLQQCPPRTPSEQLAAKFVFPSHKSKSGHIINISKQWAKLIETADLDDLRPHDLRRTMGSWQAKTGSSMVVIGKSLNHKDPAATAIYARLDMDPVRDSMTTATSAMFEAAGLKPKTDLIDFPRQAKRQKKGF